LGFLRIGVMDGFVVVSKRGLSKPFRHPDNFRPFRLKVVNPSHSFPTYFARFPLTGFPTPKGLRADTPFSRQLEARFPGFEPKMPNLLADGCVGVLWSF
jgi:hypothetical protein